ncbi:MAG: serine/threonine protein kinase [Ruminococcus sp.]|nr:serine/threonine protein kinase [Ruminococcus sp.]
MLAQGDLVDDKYRILSEIGRGGMSVVYLAINEKANKTWAIKEVRRDGRNDYNMVRQSLITEIDTLKSVKHPKLPSIVDVIEDKDSFIIVMDYIEGRSMDVILKEKGAQPEEYVKEWAKQLCDVMGYLHAQDPPIIYRDMKPSNIMLRPDGDITIIDFGTAKKYDIALESTTGLGTAGFAAPEQYGGRGRTDERTDIYALGMTLYSLLTNIDPRTTVIANRSIRKVDPSFSRGLDKIIVKCTQDEADLRYQSCAELMYDLEHIDVLDDEYTKKSITKVALFGTAALLALACGISGLVTRNKAIAKATDNYQLMIEQAEQSSDYNEKRELYAESISIPDKGGEKEAYLGLISLYKSYYDNDVFTADEAAEIEKLLINHRSDLEKKPENYIEICFELGKLFWYHYDSPDQITRAKSSVKWFEIVKENADPGYEELGIAQVYSYVGEFYRDITVKVAEASDKGMYNRLYRNLVQLMDNVAENENESEIVRLELIELARNALHQYPTKFKVDGVTKEELTELYDRVGNALDSIDVPDDTDDVRTVKKTSTQSQLSDTMAAIEMAYSTGKEGQG